MNTSYWSGRRTLVTGHTGFKGTWLALWLERLGAEVTGVALPPAAGPTMFAALAPWTGLRSVEGDLRDAEPLARALAEVKPELVFHLAAQALVRPSYRDPVGTFGVNVLGTVNVLEAVRRTPSVRTVLVVTSDKVYRNDESGTPFRESDPLGGRDPYSASKACQELVAASYRESFFARGPVRVGCVRAGNVIGGGDWGADRLVPDFVRSASGGPPLRIRQPGATRPWQHVLDPLSGYLLYAERLDRGDDVPSALNFGPPTSEIRPVRWVVDRLVELWGDEVTWSDDSSPSVPEARSLSLDAALATRSLGWTPRLSLNAALEWTMRWYRAHHAGSDMRSISLEQIDRYEELRP